MAEFISLYSGSSGNSSVVRCGSRYLIVDMGKGVRTTSAALKALGLAVSDCDGILVTHEHSDHVKGLSTFLKKNPLPVYGAADTKAGCCGSVTDLFALPFNHHPMVEQGLRAEEAGALLQAFFKDLRVRLAARPKWKRPAPPAENRKKP
mgnify:CR=1 FL=1